MAEIGPALPYDRGCDLGDSSGQRGLGGKMVMHACALDTELGRKVAKAEASISGIADMGLSQVH